MKLTKNKADYSVLYYFFQFCSVYRPSFFFQIVKVRQNKNHRPWGKQRQMIKKKEKIYDIAGLSLFLFF